MTEDPGEVRSTDGLVLPGVGAFAAGMEGLKSRRLIDVISEAAQGNKPIIGICLGAQLLLSRGHEFGEHKGLNLISGEVVHFPKIPQRVPHIGWNEIDQPDEVDWNGTILENTGESPEMYFVHSYVMQPENDGDILSQTTYGNFTFASAIRKGNVYGCQFHPEKSGEMGLNIIEKFVQLVESFSKMH